MKRILVFSTNYLPHIGGAELAIKEITERLPDTRFTLITARLDGVLPAFESIGRVSVYRVGFGVGLDKFLLPFFGFLKALRLHRQEKFEGIWCMMASQSSVSAAFFKLVNRHIPLILTLQEGDEEEHLRRYAGNIDFVYRLFIRPWHALIFHTADLVTVISKHLEARARRFVPNTPVVLIPNGVDYDFFSRIANPEARARIRKEHNFVYGDFVVITVSRLVKKNCVHDCINAIYLLPPNVKLLIIGTGELEQSLKAQVESLELRARVIFCGNVSPELIPEYLSAADVFVRPSSSEGFGSAFIEAMAARVPVIATPVGGITDFLTEKKTGLFCGIGDPKDLALKIEVVMRDQDLHLSLVEEAEDMVKERYQWKSVARAMNEKAFSSFEGLAKERILLVANLYPPDIGGPAKYAKELASGFRASGNQTSVVSFGSVRHLPTGLRHLIFFFTLLRSLALSDRVLALDTFSSLVPLVCANLFFRRKIVVRVGGDFLWEQYVDRTGEEIPFVDFFRSPRKFSLKERFIFFMTRWSLQRVHKIAFSTSWQRDIWKEPYRLESQKITVVENFYGEPLDSDTPERKNFIWAGRDRKIKNVARMEKAFFSAKRHCPEIVLEKGFLPHHELMMKIKNAYAVVVPSLSEISPNLILEAVQYGKPFIITRYNGISDRIKGLGIEVNPLDEEDISTAFVRLADKKEYESFRDRVERFNFTRDWENVSEDFIKIFEAV